MKGALRGGYTGRVLEVDLTTRTVSDYPWSDNDRRATFGGKIMAAQILYDRLKAGTDPLGADNIVVISTGPLNGTGAPSTSRFNVSALSPLTGIVASSNCGGSFGVYMKKAGIDALVIHGAAAAPVWLEVADADITFHDAGDVWGMRTTEAQEALAATIEEKAGTLVIGPAGENGVLYASLHSDERAAGRTGMGAVLGAKNLKGLAAHGTQRVEIADKDAFRAHIKKWSATLKSHPMTGDLLPKYGSGGFLPEMQKLGIVATSNFRRGRFKDASKISGQTMAAGRLVSTMGCLSCPIRCGRVVEVDGRRVKGPELETLVLLGSNLENSDLGLICELNLLLDELGMDTMTAGVTISLAMELVERGKVDWSLGFGDASGLAELIQDIAYRRGIGDELAEGSRRLGARYGASAYAMNVKGLELAAYEPRGAVGHGLGYATSNRGGCHLNGGYVVALEGLGVRMKGRSTRGKAGLTAMFQDLMEAVSAAGACLFTTYAVLPAPLVRGAKGPVGVVTRGVLSVSGGLLHVLRGLPRGLLGIPLPLLPHLRAMELVTGERIGFGRFWEVGERGYTLERELALRFGVTASDDTLPDRQLNERLDEDDPNSVVPIEKLRTDYYRHRRWDSEGRPTSKLRDQLGIEATRRS